MSRSNSDSPEKWNPLNCDRDDLNSGVKRLTEQYPEIGFTLIYPTVRLDMNV